MSVIHNVVCDTAPGHEGYHRFTFGVTCDQALAVWKLCRDGGAVVPLNEPYERVELRDDGHVSYTKDHQHVSISNAILDRKSVIAAMKRVREECRDGGD